MKNLIFTITILFTAMYSIPEEAVVLDRAYILKKVNSLRAEGCYCGRKYMKPTGPLKWDEKLYQSAITHATDMEENDFFSHYNQKGQDIGERLDMMGYNWQVAGENLGEGQKNFSEVLDDWKDSKSHCRMLMNPKVEDMAVARYGKFWVQHFGKRLPPNAKVIKSK